MKSEWKVTTNFIDGCYKYTVYRLKDKEATDHSGNREYADGEYLEDKELAEGIAYNLNMLHLGN